jgi:hypothetical protein
MTWITVAARADTRVDLRKQRMTGYGLEIHDFEFIGKEASVPNPAPSAIVAPTDEIVLN